MKRLQYLSLLLMVLAPALFYGQKYNTREGVLKFEASVPSFEEVTATNKSASAVLDASNGDIAVLALMKGFRFKVALMEEHFNENYAETSKYPKATFKGKIEGFDVAKLTSEPQSFTISGDLAMHGKTKKVTDTAKISKSGSNIIITGSFDVKPADFGIEVPKLVSSKIAEKVSITYNLSLTK